MGIVNYTYNRSTSGGEIITHLINSTDGTGLHFDGAAGYIDIPTVPDLGTKFSFEFIVQADSWERYQILFGFGTGGELQLTSHTSTSYNLAFYDGGFRTFGSTGGLEDGKPHHIVITVDDTACVLYSDGNQVGTATLGASPNVDSCTDAAIGSNYGLGGQFWDGTFYRARFWNKTLSQANITELFENAALNFADQWGSQTEKVINGAFAADTDWTKGANWTIGSGVATHAATSTSSLSQTIATLKAGATYRVTFTITAVTGGEIRPTVGGTNGTYRGTAATFTEEIVCGSNTTLSFYAHSAFAGSIDNVQVVQLGCVADYDLSYANPTQSLMVQDRAGAADGTSSATGVEQVTPIEQLNSKSARIGTSAATPADGELFVSGNAGIGTSTDKTTKFGGSATGLTVGGAVPAVAIWDTDNADHVTYLAQNGGNAYLGTATESPIYFQPNGVTRLTIDSSGNVTQAAGVFTKTGSAGSVQIDSYGNTISYTRDGGNYLFANAGSSSSLKLQGQHSLQFSTGVSQTERLRISSAGLATFANGIAFQSATTGTGTSSEAFTLDKYETGLWTPVVAGGTSAGTYNNLYTLGSYTRIGRVVTVNFVLNWNSHTGTGNLQITGLPFTCLAGTANIGTFQCNSGLSWTDGSVPALYATGTTISYRCSDEDGAAFNALQITASGNYLRGTLTYFV